MDKMNCEVELKENNCGENGRLCIMMKDVIVIKKKSEKAVQITLFQMLIWYNQIYHFHSALQILFLTSNH